MPYIVTTAKYPSNKAAEVVERFFEMLREYPQNENLGDQVVQSAATATNEGIKSLSVMEVKDGKLEEALARSAKMMAMFNEIVGFEYSLDVWQTVEEALASIGASMPE